MEHVPGRDGGHLSPPIDSEGTHERLEDRTRSTRPMKCATGSRETGTDTPPPYVSISLCTTYRATDTNYQVRVCEILCNLLSGVQFTRMVYVWECGVVCPCVGVWGEG